MSGQLAADGLPPLRDVIARCGLDARKSLGQHFLLDLNLTSRIARSAAPLGEVVEIGPGPGGLTRALLSEGAERVIAVEKDQRCLEALEEIAARWPGRLTIVSADALEFDPRPLLTAPRAAVVANLPYNVSTELLIGWLRGDQTSPDDWPSWWTGLTLMFQREVAERIVAPPGSKAYGRLSVMTAWRAEARILFDVAPQAFTPPPKVRSSIVRITPKPPAAPCAQPALERVVAAAFGQRRKMLRGSLRSLGVDVETLLREASVAPELRAEALEVRQFCALARAFAALRQ